VSAPATPAGPPRWARGFTIAASVVAAVALGVTLQQVGVGTVVDQLRAIGGWFAALVAIEVVGALCDALAIAASSAPPRRARRSAGCCTRRWPGARSTWSRRWPAWAGHQGHALMRDTDSTRAIAAVARFGMTYVIINPG
jgi:hypothetical protein